MKTKRALIVIDVQKDFCSGGSLAVPEGDTIVPIINDLLPKFDLVIFTKDWHPANHKGFASQWKNAKPFEYLIIHDHHHTEDNVDFGVVWPDHCVQDTPGADFHPDLKFENCKKDFYIFKKGINVKDQGYSAFENGDLRKFLDAKGVTETYITGLAGDYCCRQTAIDSAMAGYDTYFIIDAIKFIGGKEETFKLLEEAGVYILESWVLPLI